jgi:hypothetical protein
MAIGTVFDEYSVPQEFECHFFPPALIMALVRPNALESPLPNQCWSATLCA